METQTGSRGRDTSARFPLRSNLQNEVEEYPLYEQLCKRLKTVPHSYIHQKLRCQGIDLEHEEFYIKRYPEILQTKRYGQKGDLLSNSH